MISIKIIDKDSFNVTIDKDSKTEHIVSLNDQLHQDITNGKITKTDLVAESFKFLLKRESNQSILKKFDLKVINQYFPEYIDEIKKIIL
ncbi:MAG: hypothetical protein HOE03_00505 [Nitrosomonadales bacterium]|jgi:hypothetical protein|nr:hypothetical protein [Nitrosomonadales bacterium]MBT4758900.1 hypothetical protein [Nitrosomonadales bacterium]MBT5572906.1 hypothetical protein [Nitrosomonadales bacterium]MBT6014322.1 hypothetical protein [Nitrosomonadales bacterium]MBT6251124.1 hypothetical protein [Nitrosomonadales bacterium]